MRRDAGAVLINALVIVLVISAIAAGLLTRAEGARVRGAEAQVSAQLALYLDGIEGLLPTLLMEPVEDGAAHLGQSWATQDFTYAIDRGHVTAKLTDLQAGLNVNWLVTPDDYAIDTFELLFGKLGVPLSLVAALADFLAPGGPRQTGAYSERNIPIRPNGGPVATLPELRQVNGMTDAIYAKLAPYLSALPPSARLNLNTAAPQVLRAALVPFPGELITETLARGADDPMSAMSDFRNRLIEILATEDIDDYPVDRLTAGSDWFGARMVATLEGHDRVRRVVLLRVVEADNTMQVVYRWTEYD